MMGKKEKRCYVRRKWISFDREAINKTFNLKEMKDRSKFKQLRKEPEYQKIVELLTIGIRQWKSIKENLFESIARGGKGMVLFPSLVMLSSKHLSKVLQEKAILLYAILKRYKINVRNIIEKSILNYFSSKYRGLIPHPTTITRLYILGGIEGTWEEKERRIKTSPLTLTGLTRPPLSKDKGKAKEMEEENRESREIEQAMVVSSIKEREKRQRNLSQI